MGGKRPNRQPLRRQGLTCTLKELDNLRNSLVEEARELQKEMKIKNWEEVNPNHEFMINIVNREGLSDTWKFEK